MPHPAARPIVPHAAASDTLFPLSYGQQSLWFMYQLAPDSQTNVLACVARVRGDLDLPALQRAVQQIVDRHAALRTFFPFEFGKPVQRVLPALEVAVHLLDDVRWDATQIVEQLSKAAYHPFRLAEAPLIRVQVYPHAPQEHYLVVSVPHIVADFRSLVQIIHELAHAYSVALTQQPYQPAPLPLAFTDYVRWEAATLAGAEGVRLWTYWRQHLAGVPLVLDVPTDLPRPAVQTFRAGSHAFRLTREQSQQLRSLAEHHGTTLYTTLLAIFQTLLYHYTQQDSFLIGSPMAGRGRAEFAQLVGPCARPVVLRADLAGDPAFTAVLDRTRQTVLGAIAHQDMPFSLLVERLQPPRDSSRAPLFQVMFNYLALPASADPGLTAYGLGTAGVQTALGALVLESVGVEQPMDQFDLALLAADVADGMSATLHYNADLFRPSTAMRISADFQRLVGAVLAAPDQPLTALLAGIPRLRTALVVAATFTAEPIRDALAFWATQLGMPADIRFAPYNQVFQQLLDPSSELLRNRDGINVLLLRLEDWAAAAYGWESVEQHVQDFLSILETFVRQTTAMTLIGICPASPAATVEPAQRGLIEQLERLIVDQVRRLHGVYLLDLTDAVARYQVQERYDPMADHLGHIPFTPAFFTALGTAVMRQIYALQHAPWKVIAVDCDNTLWRGVCGEDGADGIRVDGPYVALQRFLLHQREQGMLLCLCTKNNEADVLAAFAAHPEMPLCLEHFTAQRINWLPKSENLVSLADELRLGLESCIFLDDSALECAEVQGRCPSVLTLQLPDDPTAIPAFLDHVWAFDHVRVTAEDRQRAEVYDQNQQRARLRATYPSLGAFLAALELSVALTPVQSSQMARAAELTQRTNQLNLTTIRRTESQLAQVLATGARCWVVDVRDRFGEYGLVGVVIARVEGLIFAVDTLLLSCRVLGRRVEDIVLVQLAGEALALGCTQIRLVFQPTPRNAPARAFLERIGATLVATDAGGLETLLEAEAWAERVGVYEALMADSDEQLVPAAVSSEQTAQPTPVIADTQLIGRIARELQTAEQIRKAFQVRRARPALSVPFIAPQTDLEHVLADTWTEVLGIERVGIYDNFFEIGGHSLQAVQISTQLHDIFQCEIPLLTVFFEAPTLAGVVEAIYASPLGQAQADQIATMYRHVSTLSDDEIAQMLQASATA